jgi:hypothetical protein
MRGGECDKGKMVNRTKQAKENTRIGWGRDTEALKKKNAHWQRKH